LTRRFNGGLDSYESSPFATLSRHAALRHPETMKMG
jgi:hypothetical protein